MKITEKTIELFKNKKVFTTGNGSTRIKIGESMWVCGDAKVEPYCEILTGSVIPAFIGSFSYSWSALATDMWIKRYSSLASGIRIFGVQHPYERFANSSVTYDSKAVLFAEKAKESGGGYSFRAKAIPPRPPIFIENDVWIGQNVALKPGIHIGDGAIIATGAVVTKDVPPYAIWGGVPARLLKMRFPDKIIEDMLELQWWDYCFTDFKDMDGDIPVEQFIDRIRNDVAAGRLNKYEPEVLTGTEIIKTLSLQ